MTHSIQIPIGRPMSSQAIAAALVAGTIALNPSLPVLEWHIAEDGSVRGTHAKADDDVVHAALVEWAALFNAELRTLGSCRADRQTYGVEIAHGSATLFLSGVGVVDACTAEFGGPGYTRCALAPGHDGRHQGPLGSMRTATWDADTAEVLPIEQVEQPADPCDPAPDEDFASREMSGEGLTRAQLDGYACARCGLMYMAESRAIGYVPGGGSLRVCALACAAQVEPAPTEPTDPLPDTTPPTYWRDRVGRAWGAIDGTPPSARLVDGLGLCIWSLDRLREKCGPLDKLSAVPTAQVLPAWTRVEDLRYQRDGGTWTLTRLDRGWYLSGGDIDGDDVRCGSYWDDARLIADTHIHDAEMYEAECEEGRAATEEHDPDLGRDIDGMFGEDS
ncbi:hypothetical protein [Streptomyces sp. SID3343]|uniref:hypothetical protein n=1 Tax=Streptomyces sp. SID3343 TaxID=2690260 RepID=UPI0013687460|nr:hypothetical protein [Streptomyces sp. SID3343]MYW03494.1 hypothetical protein [Streptomyces sp. SID3343]